MVRALDIGYGLRSQSTVAIVRSLALTGALLLAPGAVGATTTPDDSDWVNQGVVLDSGSWGESDAIFEGIQPDIVRNGSLYYLYYVGAKNYVTQKNNVGPQDRFIHLATSADLIHWSKSPKNPIRTWKAVGNPEEGAVAVNVTLDEAGVWHMHWAAHIAESRTSPLVSSDVRVSSSSNGIDWTGDQIVLDHEDPSVLGYGDELYPVEVLLHRNKWNLYYWPNGPVSGDDLLHLATGPSANSLTRTEAVLSTGSTVPFVGSISSAELGEDRIALFVRSRKPKQLRVFTARLDDLADLGPVIKTYRKVGFIYHDAPRRTWFLFDNRWSHYELWTAPDEPVDSTPPGDVAGLAAVPTLHDRIELSWRAASDPETGALRYRIYRDGIGIGNTLDLSFADVNLSERTTYEYEIRAVNLHGAEQVSGATVSVTTPADVRAPRISRVDAEGRPGRVTVVFDEPIAPDGAEDVASYAFRPAIAVSSARLAADERTVTLTVDGLENNGFYALDASSTDLSAVPNQGSACAVFSHSPVAGLAAYWRLDALTLNEDASGEGNHAIPNGRLSPTPGSVGDALHFDGNGDAIEIAARPRLDAVLSSSFTVSAWVRAADVPPDDTSVDGAYTVMAGPITEAVHAFELSYDAKRRFVGRIGVDGSSVSVVSSSSYSPGEWHHLALVADADAATLGLYVDGRQEGVTIFTGSLAGKSGTGGRPGNKGEYYSRYRIGARDPGYTYESHFFKGEIRGVRIHDQALTGRGIRGLREAATPRPPFARCAGGGADG